MNKSSQNIGLFVSCLVDITRPAIGFAAVKLLESAGYKVTVPPQSCCGQPAHNSGNRCEAQEIAKTTILAFENCDHIVVPSASCAGMIKHHYPNLFEGDAEWQQKALNLSNQTYELIDFLYNQAGLKQSEAEYQGRIAYHESCSALREMKVTGPRELIRSIKGAELVDLTGNEECCGFGGLFSVKFDEISNAMAETKIRNIKQAKIDLLTGVDLGCLMNISGKLAKDGSQIRVCHIAELLAGEVI